MRDCYQWSSSCHGSAGWHCNGGSSAVCGSHSYRCAGRHDDCHAYADSGWPSHQPRIWHYYRFNYSERGAACYGHSAWAGTQYVGGQRYPARHGGARRRNNCGIGGERQFRTTRHCRDSDN